MSVVRALKIGTCRVSFPPVRRQWAHCKVIPARATMQYTLLGYGWEWRFGCHCISPTLCNKSLYFTAPVKTKIPQSFLLSSKNIPLFSMFAWAEFLDCVTEKPKPSLGTLKNQSSFPWSPWNTFTRIADGGGEVKEGWETWGSDNGRPKKRFEFALLPPSLGKVLGACLCEYLLFFFFFMGNPSADRHNLM